MLKNYFKIAWRNIARHKSYTFINVTGLALGICACIVIFLITDYEFSFDKFHADGNRIYRIEGAMQNSSGESEFLNTPISDVAAFKDQLPGFEAKAPKKFDNHIPGSWSATTIITCPNTLTSLNTNGLQVIP